MLLSTQQDEKEISAFVNWLKNRLKIKYKEDNPSVFQYLDAIINYRRDINDNYKTLSKTISICKKLFFGFDIDKDETSMFDIGYSKKEKQEIIDFVQKIIDCYEEIK